MPVEDKPKNAFQPAQPKIPGVSPRKPEPAQKIEKQESSGETARPRNTRSSHILIGSSIALVLIVGALWWARGLTHPDATPMAQARAGAAAQTGLAQAMPVAPGPIASASELTHDWDAKQFVYRDASGATSPALLVRLPQGKYWAISLRAPWGSCQLEYVTDLQRIASDYGLTASHPMVVDPCSHSVFDLAKYANGPNGLVRGAIEAGEELRPPFAIEVEFKGGQILAVRSE